MSPGVEREVEFELELQVELNLESCFRGVMSEFRSSEVEDKLELPYSYHDHCDVGITPNQSSYDGLSFLPGMSTCPGEDHPN